MRPADAALSELPSIDRLIGHAEPLVERYGRQATTDALRRTIERARTSVRVEGASVPGIDALVAGAAADLAGRRPGPPRRVINATGVVVHTNLGRAPLSEAALHAVEQAAGYCDLEYDLERGTRGARGARLDPLIAEATGAEAGIAVNNAAGALVLTLAALAADREVLVSRGELVEIGGSFRLPDIMAASGARLVEVGTTNRTRAADYGAGEDVALVLKVHPSNYRITGFTEAPGVAELAAVVAERGIPLVYDVGSGLLAPRGLGDEPDVRGALAAGADLVLCSGDKLLGGPQAGLLVGRRELVARCRRHPLARALRLDKLRVAALVATLEAHLRGEVDSIPVWAMLTADIERLRDRSAALAGRVGGTVTDGASLVGGGSAPELALPGPVIRVAVAHPDGVAETLRRGDPPIVVRVEDGAVWVDLRTVPGDADDLLGQRVAAVR